MKIYLFTLFAIAIFGCTSPENQRVVDAKRGILHETSDPSVSMADVDTLIFHTRSEPMEASALISKTDLIPLETNKHSLIGSIGNIKFFDEKFYIRDNKNGNNALLVFDINGKYLFRIGSQGKGPGEYLSIMDYTIDNSGRVYILDGMRRRNIIMYNNTGEYIKSIKLDVAITNFEVVWNHIFVFTCWSTFDNPFKYLIYVMDMNGGIVKKYFPFSQKDLGLLSSRNVFSVKGNKLYVNIPYSDIIFSFDQDLTLKGEYLLKYTTEKNGKEFNWFREDELKTVFFLKDAPFCVTSSPIGYGFQWGVSDVTTHASSMITSLTNIYAKGVIGKLFGSPMTLIKDSILIEQLDPITLQKLSSFYKDSFAKISPPLRNIIYNVRDDDNPILILHTIRNSNIPLIVPVP